MAIITAGSGATIQSTTAEGQFMQLVEYFQSLEAIAGNTTNFFSGTYDSDTLVFSGNFQIPIKFSGPPSLTFVGDPDVESFPSGVFNPGTGGTFTAPLAINYFSQVVSRLIDLQNDLAKNPTKLQNLTASVNMNRKQMTGNFTMPFSRAVTATGLSITPGTYLL